MAQRGGAVAQSHTANALDDPRTVCTCCQPPSHQPPPSASWKSALPFGTLRLICHGYPLVVTKIPGGGERSAWWSAGAGPGWDSLGTRLSCSPRAKGNAPFYGLATSQNSKHRAGSWHQSPRGRGGPRRQSPAQVSKGLKLSSSSQDFLRVTFSRCNAYVLSDHPPLLGLRSTT